MKEINQVMREQVKPGANREMGWASELTFELGLRYEGASPGAGPEPGPGETRKVESAQGGLSVSTESGAEGPVSLGRVAGTRGQCRASQATAKGLDSTLTSGDGH